MAVKKTSAEGEHVFQRRSALQVPAWTEKRIGGVIAAITDRLVIPAGATLIELSALVDCYINFGDVTVDATSVIATDGSRLYMAGAQIVVVPESAPGVPFTHLAFIEAAVGSDSVIQVEQLAP